MRIRLLGPVELRTPDGSLAALAGAQRRAVLALLALHLGRPVPVERFFELLWGDEPPAQARAALQVHVAALRKVLGGSRFELLTRAPGYLLNGPQDAVDTRLFGQLTTEAETSDDATAAALHQRALGLWRGGALADLPDTELRRALAERLEESRVRAVNSWAERRLRLRGADEAIPALEQNVRADGLHEPTVALLIRCLHQVGRGSDALAVYRRARERLADELGVTPGPALREAVAAVLSDGGSAAPAAAEPSASPTGSATPATARQLPRRHAGFVGRYRESRWLDQECGADRLGDGLAVVVGPAGSGKTATVVRWAHQVAADFPDGQLFVDLRGFDPAGPAEPAEVLGRFLRALGLAEHTIPADPAARARRYRAETEHRRLLVVLDNARSAADVTALLPAGPDCATVVTSRNSLEDLVVTEGAALLRLEALPVEDALGLLERMLTPTRVRADLPAAHRLIALCDHLPLALRIAAARLASRPGWTVADLVTELADEHTRLTALDTRGALSVRSMLILTHRHLSTKGAELGILLAAHPGHEVDAYAAAALLGSDLRTARHALGDLAAYHLLTESAPGRYGRHDLVRLHGRELYAEHDEQVRRRSAARLLDYYLTAARRCADLLEPDRRPEERRAHPPAAVPEPADVRSALAWFRSEEPTIRALVATAEHAEPERAWRLAELCSGLYYGAGRLTDWLGCLRSGLAAATRLDSRRAVALLAASSANALVGVARPQDALAPARRAVAGSDPADGYPHCLALATLGLAVAAGGDPSSAVPLVERAVALLRAEVPDGRPGQLAAVLAFAASVRELADEPGPARRHAREVRRLLAEHPFAAPRLWAMLIEARALRGLQRPAEAEELWQQALARCREAGFLHLQALAEQQFADFLESLGRSEDAAEHLRSAVALYELRGYQELSGDLTSRIAGLEAVGPGAP
ncbi:BTAD domain-containing putative transcriptional regulator [Kitasatospora sp. NPDC052896]|uniref:AfsR/SARP family transcriptional regulator n=1 Tax=Kitasatospora sp. NPDC052896 TaxID=3364061 RepID=UPI0037C83062